MNFPLVPPAGRKRFLYLAFSLATLLTTLLIAKAEEVTLAWDRNPEPDVIGYKVHYGGESRAYGQAVDVGNSTLFTTPSLVQGSTYFFAVTAYNTAGLESEYSSEVQYTVPVTSGGNQVPIASDSSVETLQDQSVSFRLDATDPDGDSVTFTLLTPPSHGSLSGTAPALTYTPQAAYHGSDSFTFKVNDGALDSEPATVSIAVAAVNQPPVAAAQSVSTGLDTPVAVSLNASDPDGDNLSYAILSGPSHGTLGGTAPGLTYTPQAGYHGPDSFTFKVNDGALDSEPATVSISIKGDNTPPTAISASATTSKNSPVAVTLRGTDADGDTLSYVVLTPPANGTLTGEGPALTYTPTPGYTGSDSFTFKVNDGTIDSAPAIVSITVEHPGGSDPVARGKRVKTTQDTSLAVTLTADSSDDTPLVYQIATSPAYGTLEGEPPNLTYTPFEGFVGEDNFQFLVTCGSKTSNIATITIQVGTSLSITRPSATDNGVRLTWPAIIGETYRILYKNNLSDPVWETASPDLMASESTLSWVDSAVPGGTRFYRLMRVGP